MFHCPQTASPPNRNILRRTLLERYRFNYGRKWHLERMAESSIRLPVTDADKPDWDFIEMLMGSFPYSAYLQETSHV